MAFLQFPKDLQFYSFVAILILHFILSFTVFATIRFIIKEIVNLFSCDSLKIDILLQH